MIKKLMLFIFFPFHIFSAGFNITSDTNTAVVLFLGDVTKRSDFVLKSKPYVVDSFFAGFSSIQWIGNDGTVYGARINISGLDGWRSLTIKDNKIFIGGNLVNKMIGDIQGTPMQTTQ